MAQSLPRPNLPALLDKALALGGHTHEREDLVTGIRSGRFQYWGDDRAIIITEIIVYPLKRVLHAFIVAGDFKHAMTFLPEVRDFARIHGCEAITTTGRKGFTRPSRLPAYGFKPKAVVFELPIEENAHG